MDVVYEILMESGLMFAFFLVIGAFIYSALILFKPQQALKLNAKFNSWFSTEKVDSAIDKHIDTNEWMLKNRWWVGSMFLVGAGITLKYLLKDFDGDQFIALVIQPSTKSSQAFSEIIIDSIHWFLIFTSAVGVLACLAFLVNPESFQRFSTKLDTHYSTDSIKKEADTVYTAVDDWVMKNHIIIGLVLFFGSTYLMVLLSAMLS
ncbi:MAG: hypothetical protein H8E32_12835 [Nitrospinae bacterium]|nr:hypothetical protein [Nitrospinota bacterium]